MLNEVLQSWKVPAKCSKEEAWEKLEQRINAESSNETVVRPLYARPSAWIAAAGLALVLSFSIFLSSSNEEAHLASTTQEFALPDGSVATAKAGASLAWDGDWDERRVELDGEAFFQVEKGEKFTVVTEQGNVSVLGTSFNVYSEENGFRVECYTGKVKVEKDGIAHVITKGQCVKVREGKLAEPFEFAQMQPSWLSNGFHYTNADLDRVIEEVEARYNIEVSLAENAQKREFSGEFEDAGAEHTLALIAKAMSLNLTTIDNQTFALD